MDYLHYKDVTQLDSKYIEIKAYIVLAPDNCEYAQGSSINHVVKFLGFLTPPLPLSWSLLLK